MKKQHHYKSSLVWTGNTGKGTKSYSSYDRTYTVTSYGKKISIEGSSDPSFRGDPDKPNPEELLLYSLSSCHMLWFLHLCSVHKIIVEQYEDEATGIMVENEDGSGQFIRVILHPKVTIRQARNISKAEKLHYDANKMCFIAASVNFKVDHNPETLVTDLIDE